MADEYSVSPEQSPNSLIGLTEFCEEWLNVFWWMFVTLTADENIDEDQRELQRATLFFDDVLRSWLQLESDQEIDYQAFSNVMFQVLHCKFKAICLLQHTASDYVQGIIPRMEAVGMFGTYTEKAFGACTDFLRISQLEIYSQVESDDPSDEELEKAFEMGVPAIVDSFTGFKPLEFASLIQEEFYELSQLEAFNKDSTSTSEIEPPQPDGFIPPQPDGVIPPQPDGVIPPNGFRFDGKEYYGLSPIPWRLLKLCWESPNRCGSFDHMAKAVWMDDQAVFAGNPLKQAANKIRNFFKENEIALEITVDERSRTATIFDFFLKRN